MFGIPKFGAKGSVGQPEQQQPDGRWHTLNEEYPWVDSGRPEDAGDEHTAKEEQLHRESSRTEEEAPNQTRRQEAVVEPLIGRHGGGRCGELRCQPKDAQTAR